MANSPTACLYKETRLNLDPAYPGSTIAISIPSSITSTFASRQSGKRSIYIEQPVDQDEETFSRRHIATEASIYFRPKAKYPRNILWRILDNRKVLEIQSVDLSQSKHDKNEAILTLAFSFPHAIRPFGVAFADHTERDAVAIFVLTAVNELFTLTITKDFLIRPTASELDIGEWCKSFASGQWTYRSPYRLFALSADELAISWDEGGWLRLQKQFDDDGSSWRESYFRPGSWSSSFRSIIPFKTHSTIRFNNIDLEPGAVISAIYSPDKQYLMTASLDYSLKAWNMQTGKVVLEKDLLGRETKDLQKTQQQYMAPTQTQLMQVVNVAGREDDLFYLVTYSPHTHEFKFWAVQDSADAPNAIQSIDNLHPGAQFVPPVESMMNTTVWNLEEFHVHATTGWMGSELWIRARSGPHSKVYGVRFNLFDSSGVIESDWCKSISWTSVSEGPLSLDALKAGPVLPGEVDFQNDMLHAESCTERWLEFLFYPGRFTISTLEAALSLYRRGLGQHAPQYRGTGTSIPPLQERLAAAISSKISLIQTSHGEIDFDRHEVEIGAQWQAYYGLVRDLHKLRTTSLALVFDSHEHLPWLLHADYVAPLRKCSELESLQCNADSISRPKSEDVMNSHLFQILQDNSSEDVAKLLLVASAFRKTFSPPFQQLLKQSVDIEILQDASLSVPARIRGLDERCNLSLSVGDEDFNKLSDTVDEVGGFSVFINDTFYAAIERLGELQRGHQERKEMTRYGAKALIRGSQETVANSTAVLLDLLVLVVFFSVEIEPSELPSEFDATQLFPELVAGLKEHAVLSWLTSTLQPERPRRASRHSDSISRAGSDMFTSDPQAKLDAAAQTQTLMENIFIGDWADMMFPPLRESERLTYSCRAWTYGMKLSQQYDSVTYHVMSYLLRHTLLDLAQDFAKLLPSTAWGIYLRARLALAEGDLDSAAALLKKSGYALSHSHIDIEHVAASLLNPDERDLLTDGLSRYYQHVLTLFERIKAHTFVADFAKLALDSLNAGEKKDEAVVQEILARLFFSSIATSHFTEAYTSLIRFPNAVLRRSSLLKLIETMVSQNASATLLSFPFTAMQNDVDAVLESLCQRTLNITTGPPYHKILYSWRISRGDFRGAAAVLYDRLQRLLTTSTSVYDPADQSLVQNYLLLINVLASVDPDQAWLLADAAPASASPRTGETPLPSAGLGGSGAGSLQLGRKQKGVVGPKRRIVTLEDVRKEYQAELDRVAEVENGRFAFGGGGDEMDVL